MNNNGLSIERINWVFLGRCCELIGIENGYLVYRYKVKEDMYVVITIMHTEFILKFANFLKDNFYIEIEGTQHQFVSQEEYLSYEIHRFL